MKRFLLIVLGFMLAGATCEDPEPNDACLTASTFDALKQSRSSSSSSQVKMIWSEKLYGAESIDVYPGALSDPPHFDRYTLLRTDDDVRIVYSNLETTYPVEHYEKASVLTPAQRTTLQDALCELGAESCCSP